MDREETSEKTYGEFRYQSGEKEFDQTWLSGAIIDLEGFLRKVRSFSFLVVLGIGSRCVV